MVSSTVRSVDTELGPWATPSITKPKSTVNRLPVPNEPIPIVQLKWRSVPRLKAVPILTAAGSFVLNPKPLRPAVGEAKEG